MTPSGRHAVFLRISSGAKRPSEVFFLLTEGVEDFQNPLESGRDRHRSVRTRWAHPNQGGRQTASSWAHRLPSRLCHRGSHGRHRGSPSEVCRPPLSSLIAATTTTTGCGLSFVTRLKDRADYEVLKDRPLPKNRGVDQVIFFDLAAQASGAWSKSKIRSLAASFF